MSSFARGSGKLGHARLALGHTHLVAPGAPAFNLGAPLRVHHDQPHGPVTLDADDQPLPAASATRRGVAGAG